MEYSDVIYHSSAIFELSLNIIPKIEDSDVIHHSSAFFKLSLNILSKMEYGDVIYHGGNDILKVLEELDMPVVIL
jgi:hypothetical protein